MTPPKRKTLHVMYTDKSGKFQQTSVAMTFCQAEAWLTAIGARYWEIGIGRSVYDPA